MQHSIRNAQTNELTYQSFSGENNNFKLTWDAYYNIILSSAKILDQQRKSTRKINKTNKQRNNNGSKGKNEKQYISVNNTNQTPQYTKYTGPNMKMQADMIFSKDDWKKLSEDQRTQLIKLKRDEKRNKTQDNTSQTETPKQEQDNKAEFPPDIRSVLSTKSSKTPRSVSMAKITYSISANKQRSKEGALLDGGANGGLSGSDVRIMD